jgi:alpha-D-ribose 1-methylphosphonate 5-triphosphate synthase subunit PhnG
MMLISLDIDLAAAVKMEDFTSAVGHVFIGGRHNSAVAHALPALIGVHLMAASLMGVYLTGSVFL